jgi:LysM repeat protein
VCALATVTGAGLAETGKHKVRPGETLSGIAAQEGTTVRALTAANGVTDPHLIIAGQVLVIPGSGTGGGAVAPAAPAPAPAIRTYTVKPGDNLAGIAAKLGTTASTLASANGIRNPNLVVIGTVLSVPGGTAAAGGTGALPERLRAHPERLALRPTFEQWAAHYAVPADLLEALCWMESGWQNSVVSSTGAVGIGQLMPATVDLARMFIGSKGLDPTVAEHNIRMSAWFLGYLLKQTNGDVRLSLGAYYQGLRSVTTGPFFPETEHYVAVITALRPLFS